MTKKEIMDRIEELYAFLKADGKAFEARFLEITGQLWVDPVQSEEVQSKEARELLKQIPIDGFKLGHTQGAIESILIESGRLSLKDLLK